jgi:multidrug efflux pump subunit AcrA (membrane-fusion protein)
MDRLSALTKEHAYLKDLEEMQKLRRYDGDPGRFWRAYMRVLVSICEAETGMIVVREKDGRGGWTLLAAWPESTLSDGSAETRFKEIGPLVSKGLDKGAAHSELNGAGVIAVRLLTDAAEDGCVAAFTAPPASPGEAGERIRRLQLVSDVPASYQLARVAAEARTRVSHFASVLDLMVLLNAEKKFLSAAMSFCNELATRHGCERVSLGWLHAGYIRLQAISRVDRFDRKSDAAQKLEAAMEEALDQNAEIVMPSPDSAGPIQRDHTSYMASNDVSHLCSLPLREDAEPIAVCTCERSASPFTETDMRLLRLSCDQASRRLADLKRSDRWLGARLATGMRAWLAGLLGYRQTGAKVLVLLVCAALAVVVFARAPYRIKASMTLRTDDMAQLTAPIDGHIDKVPVRVGDTVTAGQELVGLEQTDLLLRVAELQAEKNRADREFEKAQGSGALADIRITSAQRDQAQARLAQTRFELDRAVVRSPFDGVVVEGDLAERIGSPVRQGELLVKVGRMEKLYAELEVNEADIHEVRDGQKGEIALASRPQDRLGIVVTRVEPVAVARDRRNVFLVKAAFNGGARDWWRPGMSGVARLGVGSRTLLWLLTHRTVDFLRLRLWW